MKRSAPLRRTPFQRISASVLAQNTPISSGKPILELKPATRTATYAGSTTGPKKKEPHSMNPHLRNLARGEICTGLRYGGYCHCDPATTVLAHSNSSAHGKALAYKASDQNSAFLGFDCHHFLDQGAASAEEKAAFFAAAHERTVARWREIAADPSARPWKRQAAQWAIDQLSLSTNEKN